MPVLFAWMMTIRKPGGWISILLISTFNSLVNGYKVDYVIMQFTIMTCRVRNTKLFLEQFEKKSSIGFQFLNFILQNSSCFKMYPRNQNQSLRKLAVERRRAKASGSRSIYVTLYWSTTLSETIEINRNISLSVSFFIGFIAIQWIKITARIETLMDLF